MLDYTVTMKNLHKQHGNQGLFTSDNGGGICFRPRVRVRLSVMCKIRPTQKRVHGFG